MLRIEGRPCLALPSGPNGRMIPRHKYYSNVAARLRHAPATLSRKSRSARSLTLPLRGLSCLQDHPQQRRALSTTPGASPSPPPLAPRNTIPCSTTVGVLLAEPGRHSSCSTPRRVFGASSNIRRLSAEAELTPTVATELEAGDQEHRQRRPRVRPKPGDAGNEEHEEEPQEEQERGESGKEEGKRQRVVVGMSGGVDSSVVAMLLQQQVSDTFLFFCKNFLRLFAKNVLWSCRNCFNCWSFPRQHLLLHSYRTFDLLSNLRKPRVRQRQQKGVHLLVAVTYA